MQPIFGISLYLSEANIVPVSLTNATGGELTGYLASSVTITTSLNGAALGAFTPASGTWNELGNGLYELTVPASKVSAEGAFAWRVATNPQGTNPAFNGVGKIIHRTDQMECRIAAAYDEVLGNLTLMAWLTKNGQSIPGVASCTVVLTPATGSPLTYTSVSPNADGVFVMPETGVTLALQMVHEAKVTILDSSGATWVSVKGGITFN